MATIDFDKIRAAAGEKEITVELVAERRGIGSPGGTLPNGKPDPNDPPDDGLIKAEHVRVVLDSVTFECDTKGRSDTEIEEALISNILAHA